MEDDNIRRYREQAARLRCQAEFFGSVELRQQLIDIAAQYDRLADSIAQIRGGHPEPSGR